MFGNPCAYCVACKSIVAMDRELGPRSRKTRALSHPREIAPALPLLGLTIPPFKPYD
jgi:hypothetical protein